MKQAIDPEGITEAVLKPAMRHHQQRVQRLQTQGVSLDGLVVNTKQCWTKRSESIVQKLPPDVTVAQLLDCTTDDDLEEMGEREQLCARCPPTGGRCYDKPNEGMRPEWRAHVARWNAPGLIWTECERWQPYLLDRRMRRWGFPRIMLRAHLAEYDAHTDEESEAVAMLQEYIIDFYGYVRDGAGIAIYGDVGVGKTTLACAVCRELLERHKIRVARYWDVADLLARLRPQKAEDDQRAQIVQDCMACAVLVLDDLGAHNTTEWVREQIGIIVNHRWSNGLPTITTTNARIEEAEQSIGERTMSRLLHNTITIGIEGPDKRAAG